MSFCSSEKPPGKVMKNLFNLWICVKWCHCSSITRLYRQRAGGERLLHHRCDADSGMTSWLQMACSLLLPVCPNAHHKSDTFDRICAVIHFCLLRRTVEVCVCVLCLRPDCDWLNVFCSQTWTPAMEEGCLIWLRGERASSSATLKTTWRTPWWTPPTRLWIKWPRKYRWSFTGQCPERSHNPICGVYYVQLLFKFQGILDVRWV